jgi:hypothetical protein
MPCRKIPRAGRIGDGPRSAQADASFLRLARLKSTFISAKEKAPRGRGSDCSTACLIGSLNKPDQLRLSMFLHDAAVEALRVGHRLAVRVQTYCPRLKISVPGLEGFCFLTTTTFISSVMRCFLVMGAPRSRRRGQRHGSAERWRCGRWPSDIGGGVLLKLGHTVASYGCVATLLPAMNSSPQSLLEDVSGLAARPAGASAAPGHARPASPGYSLSRASRHWQSDAWWVF